MHPGLIIAGALSWLFALLCYLGYRKAARRYDAIFEVPTIAARDIPGLGAASVEVKGFVEAAQPLLSDLARVPCVAFSCSVTEHWTTTRTVRDSKGNTRTQTQHHSETRYANSEEICFEVRDLSGTVTIRPAGASIDMLDMMRDLDGPLPDSPAYGISARHFGGRIRYAESALPVGQEIYVLGQVSKDHCIQQPCHSDRPFLISYRSESDLLNSARWGKRIWATLAVVLFLGGFVAGGVMLGGITPRPARQWSHPEAPIPSGHEIERPPPRH